MTLPARMRAANTLMLVGTGPLALALPWAVGMTAIAHTRQDGFLFLLALVFFTWVLAVVVGLPAALWAKALVKASPEMNTPASARFRAAVFTLCSLVPFLLYAGTKSSFLR